jgi:hypothetical protein
MTAWIAASAWVAQAATWSEPRVWPAEPLALPAGSALRLTVWPADADVALTDTSGDPVSLRATEGGWLVPASGLPRLLTAEATPGAVARWQTVEDRGDAAAWFRWWTAAGDTPTPPAPPNGGPQVADAIALRNRAVSDLAVRRLGACADALDLLPLDAPLVRRPRTTEGPTAPVEGPAVAVVTLLADGPAGEWVRAVARVRVDGREVVARGRVTAGGAPTRIRVWVPPGLHVVEAALDGTPAVASIEVHGLRPGVWTLGDARVCAPRDEPAASAGERAWLCGDLEAARAAFRTLETAPNAAGELARARLLATETDPTAALRLLALDAGSSRVGQDALTEAALTRAALLPTDTLRARVAQASHPDPEQVAAWLDAATPGSRAPGAALLAQHAPAVPLTRAPALAAQRQLAWATRATRLPSDRTDGEEVLGAAPGVRRARVDAGVTATVTVPERSEGGATVVRMWAPGPTTWSLDGQPRATAGGRVDEALAPGAHALRVDSGALLGLDPELWTGTTPVWSWTAVPLPARFALPDPGLPAEISVDFAAGDHAWAAFDDGAVAELTPAPDTGRATARVGAGARAVTLTGGPDVRVSVSLRARPSPPTPPTPLPTDPVPARLAALTAQTRAVDAQVPGARAARAALLASLGERRLFYSDLGHLTEDEQAPLLAAWRERLPSRDTPGPETLEAACAVAGAPPTALPAAPAARAEAAEALARAHPHPALWAAVADAWIAADEPLRAWSAAVAAANDGAKQRVLARFDWRSLPGVDQSAGLVRAPAPDPDPERDRVRAALRAAPWPADETLVLRGTAVDVVRAPGREARLAIACRDEALLARPCVVPIRAGAARETWTIADGAVREAAFSGGDLEVGGPGPDHALTLRLTVDGQTPPPAASQLAIRVTPSQSATAVIAGAALLRVDVVAGPLTASWGAATGTAPTGGSIWLAAPASAPQTLTVSGEGIARIARGAPTARPPPPPPPATPESAFAETPDWATALLTRWERPPEAAPREVGDWGSVQFGASVAVDQREQETPAWIAASSSAAWMRSWTSTWATSGLWMDLPGVAAGGAAEVGARWPNGRAALAPWGAVAVAPAAAMSGGLNAYALHDLAMHPDVDLRGRVDVAVGAWSDAPPEAVDPRVWTDFDADHPAGVTADLAAVARPTRDLRLQAGARATSNAGPSIDRAGGYARAHWLAHPAWVIDVGGSAQWRFADADRPEPYLRPSIDLGVEGAWWTARRDRWSSFAEVAVLPALGGAEGVLGVRWWGLQGRGLRDLPPDREPFRSLREDPHP